MTPLVSILIPAYNAGAWITPTLEAALAQTHPRVEIIVIDDGSTDNTRRLAGDFRLRGVRVVAQPNRGAAAARNTALGLATGDYIQFLDADDLLDPGKISNQLALLAAASPGKVASCAWARFSTSPSEEVFRPEPTWRDLSGFDFLELHYQGGWMMPPIAWLCPRALLTAVGPWREDLSLNDDGEYFCRVLLRSTGIIFCPRALAYYRSGVAGSLSQQNNAAALASLDRSIQATTRALIAHENAPRGRRAAANAWRRLAHDLYPTLPSEAAHAEQQALALGGSHLRVEGGRLVRATERIFGWRAAARLKHYRRSHPPR